MARDGADPDRGRGVYMISVAAELAGMHPQTLRGYERVGLVTPRRTAGGGRRYSMRDILALREIQRLSQDEGINLAGVKRIIALESHVDALRTRVTELQAELAAANDRMLAREREVHASYRRDLVPVEPGAVVVWRPSHRSS